jgi:hypothetical protein
MKPVGYKSTKSKRKRAQKYILLCVITGIDDPSNLEKLGSELKLLMNIYCRIIYFQLIKAKNLQKLITIDYENFIHQVILRCNCFPDVQNVLQYSYIY